MHANYSIPMQTNPVIHFSQQLLEPDSITIRSAHLDDVGDIQHLIHHYSSMGQLLPRSKSDIEANIQRFKVVCLGDEIIACGALEFFTPELAEIRSFMIKPSLPRQGIGRKLMEEFISDARALNVKRLMALTYVPGFFHKLGFHTVNKEIFPEKVWGICVNCYKFKNCDEIAVLLELK